MIVNNNNINDMQNNALELCQINHSYGNIAALKRLNITIRQGEVVCLLGPSGCGKTTALRVAAGLEMPNSGEVFFAGKKVAGDDVFFPPEQRNIGLVFQDYALFPHLTINDNIAFGIKNLPSKQCQKIIIDMLDEVGMSEYGNHYPHMLSGGQQQRIALARALARNSSLILMDEPFSGLDARLRDKIRDNTLHILKKFGAAALMVTHDAEEAMYMADRIAVMLDGKIVQIGTPDELYFKPKTAFIAEFFGEINHISAMVKNGKAETPLGQINTIDFNDGELVEVIIRPEGLSLEDCPQSSTGNGYATVLASRFLGRTSLVHLCTCATSGIETHLHARVSGKFKCDDGRIFKLAMDDRQVFVFPVKK